MTRWYPWYGSGTTVLPVSSVFKAFPASSGISDIFLFPVPLADSGYHCRVHCRVHCRATVSVREATVSVREATLSVVVSVLVSRAVLTFLTVF